MALRRAGPLRDRGHRRVPDAVPRRLADSGERSHRPRAAARRRAAPAARRPAPAAGRRPMSFNAADLQGVLPAIILSVGALFLLTSEVFLRNVRPAVLGHSGGQPTSAAERAEAELPPGSQGASA